MDFRSLEGFEEFFVDGVINPAVASSEYREKAKVYRKLTDRVFALHEPAQPEFDVVFLHGIGSDEFHCWSNRKGLLWPAEFLPQDFPTARILTVGYEHSLWNWKKLEKEDTHKQRVPPSNPGPEQEGSFSKAWESFSDTVESSLSSWWGKSGGDSNDLAKKSVVSTTPPGKAGDATAAPPELSEEQESSSLLEVLMSVSSSASAERLVSPAEAATQGSASLQRVAADVASRLLSPDVGVGARPVVFIVHSMGGLVTKRMLVSLYQVVANAPPPLPDRLPEPIASIVGGSGEGLREASTPEAYSDCLAHASALLSMVRGVVFYCTPHFGSGLASVITGMQRYYQSIGGLTPTHVVTGLGDHNKDELRHLNAQFVDLIERLQECREGDDLLSKYGSKTAEPQTLDLLRTNPPGFTLLSFGETLKLHNLVRVVEPESANPVPDDPRFPFHLVHGDHGSVNRPETKTSPAYSLLYGFLDRMQQRGRLRLDCIDSSPTTVFHQLAAGIQGKLLDAPTAHVEIAVAEVAANTANLDELWAQCFRESASATTLATDPTTATAGDRDCATSVSAPVSYCDSGRNEAALSARLLHDESERLHRMLSQFFGRASSPELDGVLQLSSDILTLFRRLQEALVHVPAVTTAASGTVGSPAVRDAVLESFNIPILLAVHWTRWTTQIIQRFELQQRERHLTALESMSGWGAARGADGVGAVSHLYTAEVEEIQMMRRQISVLQGEWEGFRRYTILHIRSLLTQRDESVEPSGTGSASRTTSVVAPSHAFELLSNQSITTLFFSKALRSAVSHQLHDGGFFSSLLSHYMGSVVALGVSPLSLSTPVSVKGVHGLDALERLVQERDYALSLLLESMASTSSSLLQPATADDLKGGAAARRLSSLALTPEQLTTMAAPLLAMSSFLRGCVASTFRHDLWGSNHGNAAAPRFSQALRSMAACHHAFDKQYRFAREGPIRLRGVVGKESQDSWWPNKVVGKNSSQGQESIDDLDKAFNAYTILSAAMELGTHVLLTVEYLHEVEQARSTCITAASSSKPTSPTLTAAVELLTTEVTAAQRSYENLERVTRRDAAAAELSKPFTKATTEPVFATQRGTTNVTASADSDGVSPPSAEGKEMDILEAAKATFKEAMSKLLREMEESEKKDGGDSPEKISVNGARDEKKPTMRKKGTAAATATTTTTSTSSPATTTPASVDGGLRSLLSWPSKPTSGAAFVTLFINSVISAWETVRRGEDKPLTPIFFAHSMMVAWWAAEERVAVVGEELCASSLIDQLRQRRKSPKTPAVVLEFLTAAAVGGATRAESTAAARASGTTAATPIPTPPLVPVATLAGYTDPTLQLLQNVDHTVSSEWLALRGATIEKATMRAALEEQQRRVEAIGQEPDASAGASTTAAGTVDSVPAPPPAPALPVPLASPFVVRALQLDNGNALAQCLEGNRAFLRLRTSPDAAHAYQNVLRRERVASSPHYRQAAVGLAWIHLHRVASATMEIANTQSNADLHSVVSSQHNVARSVQRAEAALLGRGGVSVQRAHSPCQVGVVDTLSAFAAPVNFLAFYKRGWEAASMGERQTIEGGLHTLGKLYASGNAATPAQMAAGRFISQEALGRSRSEVTAAHRAMQSALGEHLALSKHYFTEVLQYDPTNVGALCGVGRLCTLALPNAEDSGLGWTAPSALRRLPVTSAWEMDALLPMRGHSTTLREATQYFIAALADTEPALQMNAHRTGKHEPFSEVNNVFRSYAANWLGDYARPEAVDFVARSRTLGAGVAPEGPQPHPMQHEADTASKQRRFDASCAEAVEWYTRAVRYSGLNDWALCNLGVLQLQRPSNSDNAANIARGLGLVEKALELNPANQWALWAISLYSPHPARQHACRAALRRRLTMSFRSTFL